MFSEEDWQTLLLEMTPPVPIPREYKTDKRQKDETLDARRAWEAWKSARKENVGEESKILAMGKTWFALQHAGFSNVRCEKPFVSAWKTFDNRENSGEVVAISCAKWETMCLLHARVIQMINKKPVKTDNLLVCMACCDKALEELRQWTTSGNLAVDEEHQDDTFRAVRALPPLDACFYEQLQKTCAVLYHAQKLKQFSEKVDQETLAHSSGNFLSLIEEAERAEKETKEKKYDFTSLAYDKLQSFISSVRQLIDESASKTMVEKCKKAKMYAVALYWQQRVMNNEPKSVFSWSPTPAQEDYDVIVRLAKEDGVREPRKVPLPSISAEKKCF